MKKLQTLQFLVDPTTVAGERPCVLALQAEGIARWTYADVASHVERLANGLIQAGVQRGDHVVLLAANRPEWVIVCLAVLRAGAVILPLDTQINNEALRHVLHDSETQLIFTTVSYMRRLQRLELERPPRTVLLDVPPDEEQSWQQMLSDDAQRLPEVQPDDYATLFYTSGTTGAPKGVPLTHTNLATQLNAVQDSGTIHQDDSLLLPLPMYHVYPFTIGTLVPLSHGIPIVLPQSLTGPQLFRALREGAPTIMVAVPRLYRALYTGIERQFESRGRIGAAWFRGSLNLSIWLLRRLGIHAGKWLLFPLHRRVGTQLRLMTSGGSALDPELAWKLEGLGWRVAIGYGLTETSPLLTMNLPHIRNEPKLGSVGSAMQGVSIHIDTSVRSEGDTLPPEESGAARHEGEGEIVVRGPSVFQGYRNLPDVSAEVLNEDGWFRTGDLGYFDGDGYLYISGRASTLIVTEGGKNIQPEPVEEVYQGNALLQEVAVLQEQNQLVALVFPDMEAVKQRSGGDPQAIEQAIREALGERAAQLPSYQRVSDVAISSQPLPRTNLGKLRRHLLNDLYRRAKQSGTQSAEEVLKPMEIAEMTDQDRDLLEYPAALDIWHWLAERYHDQRLTPDTNPQLELGIDSLAWLNMTLEISERTGVELDEAAVSRISTVRDLLREIVDASERRPDKEKVSPIEHPEEVLTEAEQHWMTPVGTLLRALGVLIFVLNRALARVFFRVEVEGLEHLPEGKPCVLAPNHTSYLDPFAVASVLSYPRLRQTYWAGSVYVLFTSQFKRAFSRVAQVLPVAGDTTGRASLAFAALTFKRNKNLVWFPEGSRSENGELQPFKHGLGMVLEKYPVPVVPVFIHGAYEAWPMQRRFPRPGKIKVVFGPPCEVQTLQQQGQGEHAPARIASALQEQVAELGTQTALVQQD